jgi:regulatory protein
LILTAVERLRNPARVRLFVDGEPSMEVAAEVLQAEGLRVDDAVSEARLAALERADRVWLAREAALRLLATRPRSAAEISRRLRARGFSAEEVEPVLVRLGEVGLVDDAAFAAMLARERVRARPQGKRRMLAELRGRGVDEETAREAVREATGGDADGEAERARRAAARWRPRPGEEPRRARARLYAFLARRGFDGEVAREVAESVLGGPDEGT